MKKDDFVLSTNWGGLKEWVESFSRVAKKNWNFLSFIWGFNAGIWTAYFCVVVAEWFVSTQ